ncbi:hypothetical protein BGW80DRAFT_1208832 [Lactifluus volemus]|nr:hypothetical protein BGW80DRAFT_1208832 [Lactifluus volemus]
MSVPGEGSNGKASGIPPSGNVGHEGAGQANADHAPDPAPNPSGPNPEPPKAEDFNDGANGLWALYETESKRRDEVNIKTLSDHMEGVFLFGGLFSAAITGFIINSVQSLRPNPADQTAYYMQQGVAMLAQISQQISSIAPQVVIPLTPPPPFPTFKPLSSDIRVNAFWFMSLVSSLSAALLALLVRQWVRNYMRAFEQYKDPLKRSRLRQYLHEGSERWYFRALAEAVPALLHISLFLFLVGLVDFNLNLNTTVAAYTIIPIGITGLFYVFTTLSPILNPQSPYQNSFSELIGYLIQNLHARHYKDRDGQSKPLSTNMTTGQMELAMEKTDARMGRDERAILWLVKSMTENAEIESFAMAIPGSFNTDWGVDVWQGVSDRIEEEKNNSLSTSTQPSSTDHNWLDSILRFVGVRGTNHHHHHTGLSHSSGSSSTLGSIEPNQGLHELSKRVGYLLGTCNDPGHFSDYTQWHQRTRACVETTAELIFRGNSHLGWFGDITKVLHDVAMFEKIREIMASKMDQSFVARWTYGVTQKLISQLPGIQFDNILPDAEPPNFGEALHFLSISPRPLSVLPWQHLQGLCSIAPKLRDIIQSQNTTEYRGTLESLKSLVKATDRYNRGLTMESQLARWQDLRDGDGLGVAVELFFITLGKVLPTSTLEISQHDLYIGAFKRITYDWEKRKDSHGTQKVILNVAFDLTMRLPELGIPLDADFDCPEDFKVCLLKLLGNILEGQTGPHIDEAVGRLRDVRRDSLGQRRMFAERVLEVINPHFSYSHWPVSVA